MVWENCTHITTGNPATYAVTVNGRAMNATAAAPVWVYGIEDARYAGRLIDPVTLGLLYADEPPRTRICCTAEPGTQPTGGTFPPVIPEPARRTQPRPVEPGNPNPTEPQS